MYLLPSSPSVTIVGLFLPSHVHGMKGSVGYRLGRSNPRCPVSQSSLTSSVCPFSLRLSLGIELEVRPGFDLTYSLFYFFDDFRHPGQTQFFQRIRRCTQVRHTTSHRFVSLTDSTGKGQWYPGDTLHTLYIKRTTNSIGLFRFVSFVDSWTDGV